MANYVDSNDLYLPGVCKLEVNQDLITHLLPKQRAELTYFSGLEGCPLEAFNV